MPVRSMGNLHSGWDDGTGRLASTFITATSNAQPIPGGLNVRSLDRNSFANLVEARFLRVRDDELFYVISS
jgi:hypothetical protein